MTDRELVALMSSIIYSRGGIKETTNVVNQAIELLERVVFTEVKVKDANE